jgi:hypothetical protein
MRELVVLGTLADARADMLLCVLDRLAMLQRRVSSWLYLEIVMTGPCGPAASMVQPAWCSLQSPIPVFMLYTCWSLLSVPADD